MALCGLFAALMAICSFISIPLGFTPVPVNLGTLGVFLTGGVLGRKYGTVSMTVYVLLGAVGVPVFAGFRGGLSVLVGPTGGYIIGYIAAAFLIGWLVDLMLADKVLDGSASSYEKAGASSSVPSGAETAYARSRTRELICCIAAMIIGLLTCYTLGTAWFIISTNTGVWASLAACVFPFLPGDALKIAAGAFLVQKLRRMI